MIKTLIPIFLIMIVGPRLQSQDVFYTLVNSRDTIEATEHFFLIDVLAYSNSGFKLGSGQLYFNYDTIPFGANIFNAGALDLQISENSILGKKIGSPPFHFDFYGDFITNDNTIDRFSISWQHDFSYPCLDTVNIDYYSGVLFTIRIKYKEGQAGMDSGLCLEDGINYTNQTFTACGPGDCNTNDCFNFPGVQILTDIYQCDDCRIVYSTLDSGVGSLRKAINCISAGDTIRFAPNLKMDTIKLTSLDLELNKSMHILSRSTLGITIQAETTSRVFNILNNNEVVMEGLALKGGASLDGDCILNLGELTLRDMTLVSSLGNSGLKNSNEVIIEGKVIVREEE